jgi:hypothetical protein
MQFDMKIMPLDETVYHILKFFIAVCSYSRQAHGQAIRVPED